MPTWSHPQLGDFEFDEHFWCQTVELPAFAFFRLGSVELHGRPGDINIVIQALDETDAPTESIVNLINTVLGNHELLIQRVVEALFDEFNGTGPTSGMWWHGEIEELRQNTLRGQYGDIDSALGEPCDLQSLLSRPEIGVREIGWHVRPWVEGGVPVAEFLYDSPIDPEHGIGVLTDGTKIVGIGYSWDATYFSDAKS